MDKLLYLFAGIMLKQLVDEIKAINAEYVEYWKKYRDAIAEYRPTPARRQGSPEAASAIARWQHEASVGPQVQKISRKIRLIRLIPVAIYGVITLAAIGGIIYFETRQKEPTMAKRDEFPKEVKRRVALRAGYLCSNPDCRRPTCGPHSDQDEFILTGHEGRVHHCDLFCSSDILSQRPCDQDTTHPRFPQTLQGLADANGRRCNAQCWWCEHKR